MFATTNKQQQQSSSSYYMSKIHSDHNENGLEKRLKDDDADA
jgi:hypothetical protein